MILLFGSQMQMFAQKKGGSDYKKPGVVQVYGPGKPIVGKAISQGDIARLQDFYWKKYRVKLSKKEAEKILIAEKQGKHDFACKCPDHKRKGPGPKGQQRPSRR